MTVVFPRAIGGVTVAAEPMSPWVASDTVSFTKNCRVDADRFATVPVTRTRNDGVVPVVPDGPRTAAHDDTERRYSFGSAA